VASALPSASGSPAASASPVVPALLSWEVVDRIPHDPDAWIEGLLIDAEGRLWESTGIIGATSVREVDRMTGAILRQAPPPGDEYGEGLAMVDDRLLQLTWTDGVALEWDPTTLQVTGSHPYEGEGWGLCDDGTRLVHSDGTARLRFRERTTFAEIGAVDVTLEGRPVEQLNELECVDGDVWANVWQTDEIVRIDPTTGTVTGVLDLAGLLDPGAAQGADVLNGIAHRPDTGTFLVTGKLWPTLFELRVTGPGTPG
jgi:glutamine cyclotransferase